MLRACRAGPSVAVRTHLLPQRPKLLRAADAVVVLIVSCLSDFFFPPLLTLLPCTPKAIPQKFHVVWTRKCGSSSKGGLEVPKGLTRYLPCMDVLRLLHYKGRGIVLTYGWVPKVQQSG